MMKRSPWIGLLLLALFIKLSLPYYGGLMVANNANAGNENRDQRILMCTATGLKWVAAFTPAVLQDSRIEVDSDSDSDGDGDKDDKKSGDPFLTTFKCAFCLSAIDHFTVESPELHFIAKLLFPKILSRWYGASLSSRRIPFWFIPLLRAPPVLFLTA